MGHSTGLTADRNLSRHITKCPAGWPGILHLLLLQNDSEAINTGQDYIRHIVAKAGCKIELESPVTSVLTPGGTKTHGPDRFIVISQSISIMILHGECTTPQGKGSEDA